MNAATLILGIQFAASLVLAALIVRRGVHRTLPFFSAYVFYSTVTTALLWASVPHVRLYFYVYWLTEAGDLLLVVAATCESFAAMFRGFFVLAWFRWLLPALAILVGCYAIWKAMAHPPVLNSPTVSLIVGLEIALRYFIAGVFILYVGGRRYLKICASGFQYNVMLGFFLSSAAMLLATIVRSEFGTKFPLITQWSAAVGYCAALCVWLFSLVRPPGGEKYDGEAQVTAASAIQVLQQYSSALKKVQR